MFHVIIMPNPVLLRPDYANLLCRHRPYCVNPACAVAGLVATAILESAVP
jgi:hypothetical protein